VFLQGFLADYEGKLEITSMFFRDISWSVSSDGVVLEFSPVIATPPGLRLSITLPSEAGVRISPNGVRKDSPTLTMAVHPVVPARVPIIQSPEVDSVLANRALRFTGGAPGAPTVIVLSFRTEIDLAEGEVITLTLPRFTKTGTPCLDVVYTAVPSNLFSVAEWIADKQVLILGLAYEVSSGQQVSVTVAGSAGFLLPSDGIKATDEFILATDAVRAPVAGAQILDLLILLSGQHHVYGWYADHTDSNRLCRPPWVWVELDEYHGFGCRSPSAVSLSCCQRFRRRYSTDIYSNF
jgi:hypothetical protein